MISLIVPNLTTIAGKFLVGNYKQALEVLAGEPAIRALMYTQGIEDATFSTWLKEEREYLEGLKKEPEAETLEMEYYIKLVAYFDYQ